jgi:hypothetical protein
VMLSGRHDDSDLALDDHICASERDFLSGNGSL